MNISEAKLIKSRMVDAIDYSKTMSMEDLDRIKVGDTLERVVLWSTTDVIVGHIDENFIHCGNDIVSWEDGWKFWKHNGCECDETINSDGLINTYSYLTKIK